MWEMKLVYFQKLAGSSYLLLYGKVCLRLKGFIVPVDLHWEGLHFLTECNLWSPIHLALWAKRLHQHPKLDSHCQQGLCLQQQSLTGGCTAGLKERRCKASWDLGSHWHFCCTPLSMQDPWSSSELGTATEATLQITYHLASSLCKNTSGSV